MDMTSIRRLMRNHHAVSDAVVVDKLTSAFAPSEETRARIEHRAGAMVDQVRSGSKPSMTEAFLSEYGLSTDEGVAIMTLAEALLRVPDPETQDSLIEDKTTDRAWMSHAAKSENTIVNLSTVALSVTGTVLEEVEGNGVGAVLRRATKRLGAPVIRTAVGHVMRELGHQFVLGETIQKAITRAQGFEAQGYTYSYDMLGEAAMTAADAQTFYDAYEQAIHAIGQAASGDSVEERAGISVKLSALHPRYEFLKGVEVIDALASRLAALCNLAAGYNIGLNVDAEEADRLDISLDIIQAALAQTPNSWQGFGVVVQAYGKRASFVLDWLYALAKDTDRTLMVRLVKGAYWDTEIKQAQVQGLPGYPVFCSKAATDVSYICCAAKLLGMRDRIYPQFASHNAHTLAAVTEIAGNTQGFEFQRLHGMGEALHDVTRAQTGARCRIYAPVGAHRELLAYLVRRLLENGANSSFVNQIVNKEIPTSEVIADPFVTLEKDAVNSSIPAPADLFQPERVNSKGLNIQNITEVEAFEAARAPFLTKTWEGHPLTAVEWTSDEDAQIVNPSNPDDTLGSVAHAAPETVTRALAAAVPWANTTDIPERQRILTRAADLFEAHFAEFAALLGREAGKTLLDVDAEVREAVDFLRYYAAQSAAHSEAQPKGVVAAISPWNFPLAIFTGQISAALAAGNAVLAKPAEATPLTAFVAVQLMRQAGVPDTALQLLPGRGSVVGAALSKDPKVNAMCFTGSTATAQKINRVMAQNLHADATLLAETGGLNAMIVDSTALPEQVIKDVVASAFQSAGQRCSALRVLYVQVDIADGLLTMLKGAMDELTLGDPLARHCDLGPVIDTGAKATIDAHIAQHATRVVKQIKAPQIGSFVGPTLIEIDSILDLETEIFGPVLHVCRYRPSEMHKVLRDINATGYALTFGFHSRIEGRAEEVAQAVHAGNIYINRNQIGAVVGSQPFGGEGLSGTGPKAGGPRYLTQFLHQSPQAGFTEDETRPRIIRQNHITDAAARMSRDKLSSVQLPGPTGESNILTTSGRGVVLCLGPGAEARKRQKHIAEEMGSVAIAGSCTPADIGTFQQFAAVAFWGDDGEKRAVRRALAERAGPILPLLSSEYAMRNFVREQHVCIDTTAAGGNAALLAGASLRPGGTP